MYMVQSQVQYEFLYQVLKEKFQRRGKSASPPGTSTDGDSDNGYEDIVEPNEEFKADGGVLLHS